MRIKSQVFNKNEYFFQYPKAFRRSANHFPYKRVFIIDFDLNFPVVSERQAWIKVALLLLY